MTAMRAVAEGASLVSVVIPTKDRNDLLAEALSSVLAQSWPAIEAIVVADGGVDDPSQVIEALGGADARLRLVRRADHRPDAFGAQVARNLGYALSRGAFVLFLDDDDRLAPDCIAGRMRVLMAEPALDFCVARCSQFDGDPAEGDPLWGDWSASDDDLLLFLGNLVPWQTSGPLWRRSALDAVGGWDETLDAGHDYEFHIRALAHGLRYRRIDRVDFHWRKPRKDSFSHFEAFKRQHRAGAHVLAFARALEHVGARGAWTAPRRDAAWREAVRLAVTCRLYGGAKTVAIQSLYAARQGKCVGPLGYLEAQTCIAAWTHVRGKIPAMSYLNWRGLLARRWQPYRDRAGV